jgi:glycosyltransferase involved in cell wall biosynthesis
MKVLFIASANSKVGILPIIKSQGESLEKVGIQVDYFPIVGKGIFGYLNSAKKLKKFLNKNKYDIVHAHYSFCGFVATLAGAKPIVVSLMGWGGESKILKILLLFFNKISWKKCIVKSKRMAESSVLKGTIVIPNGVDMGKFKPIDRSLSQQKLGWDSSKKHILFAANSERKVKNFQLTQKALDIIDSPKLALHVLKNVKHSQMHLYYNASDVVVLTSLSEGSPNVIKEALACNAYTISTDVGDVKERFKGCVNCELSSFYPEDLARKIQKGLDYSGIRNSRDNISEINSNRIANKLRDVYKSLLELEGD